MHLEACLLQNHVSTATQKGAQLSTSDNIVLVGLLAELNVPVNEGAR